MDRSVKLFGTDGIRGEAGQSRRSTETTVRARRRGAGARARRCRRQRARADRPRHARIRRRGSRRRWRAGWPAKARSRSSVGVVPTPAVAYLTRSRRLRRGHRDLGVAQSVRGQRHQGVLGARREVRRGRSRRRSRRSSPTGLARRRSRRPRALDADPTLVRALCRPPARDPADAGPLRGSLAGRRLRQRRDQRPWRRRFSRARIRRRRDRRPPGRPQHQPRLRLDAPRWLRGSGASSARRRLGVAFDGDGDRALFVDQRGRVVDGDAVLLIAADQLRREGRLPRQRRRRHGDEQHRPRAGAARARASSWCARRSATST